MKILKEAKKEILPVDFVAGFISRSWEEVASLKASIAGIKQTFSGTKDIESILEELLDAYLITIGQLQQILENKDIVIPESNKKLKEELIEEIKEEKDTTIEDSQEEISDKIEDNIEYNIINESIKVKNTQESDDFFNSDFEEPEFDESESDFVKWQRQHNR